MEVRVTVRGQAAVYLTRDESDQLADVLKRGGLLLERGDARRELAFAVRRALGAVKWGRTAGDKRRGVGSRRKRS